MTNSTQKPVQFDAIIIGAGQAGNPLSAKLVKEGWKIAVIEKEHEGGSCVNFGCTPTKAMISSAAAANTIAHADEWGINVGSFSTEFNLVIERRDEIVKMFRSGTTDFLEKEEKIKFYRGTASFAGKKIVQVKDQNGEEHQLTADKIFINTGSVPRKLQLKGLEDITYYTSHNWMDIHKLPEPLCIIGGGYIGVEFAQLFSRLGSRVILLQKHDQLMPREDRDIAEEIHKFLKKDGVEVKLNADISRVKNSEGNKIQVQYTAGEKTEKIDVSHLLIAAGTVAATELLNLKAGGIEADNKGYIKVNEKLETSIEGIYALGDCKGGPEFTHISYDDYRVLENHLFGNDTRSLNDRPLPYVLFTEPQLGRIGFNEKEARKRNITYRKAEMPAGRIARAIETGHTT
ncbi:MAG TPA: FAD-dependent oxidoreductase, partial [Bacteroidales bacterium]|nr:FAD-dependent oxidoreductase [Bacteroidales bacterium]